MNSHVARESRAISRRRMVPGVMMLFLLSVSSVAYAKDGEWRKRELLVGRLSGELYKMDILQHELSNIDDILGDLRNLELFPEPITRLADSTLVVFDRKIELLQKKHKQLGGDVTRLEPALVDALQILREMVVGQPVDEMFEVLEEGDLERIKHMMRIKHEIDTLYQDTDSLLDWVGTRMGLPNEKYDQPRDDLDAFVEVIRAGLGKRNEPMFRETARLVDSLVGRASPTQTDQMFRIEIARMEKTVTSGKKSIVKRKLETLKKRYSGTISDKRLHRLLVRLYFAVGDYHSALNSAQRLPADSEYDSLRVNHLLQSRYALSEHQAIWDWALTFDFSTLNGKDRNLALWIAIESGIALGKEYDYSQLADGMVKNASYNVHLLHAFSRTYSVRGDYRTALSVLKSALRLPPISPRDESALRQIQLTTAQTYFETGEVETALKAFFELLDSPDHFANALYGIAWCYISLGMYRKAETTLRKLISQNPESPLAADAILITARRYVNKAEYEWNRFTHLHSEQDRLQNTLRRVENRRNSHPSADSSRALDSASAEISAILERLGRESIPSYSYIADLYRKSVRLCEIAGRYYETGTFQETNFSRKREQLLHQLDSVLTAVNSDSRPSVGTTQQTNSARIREIKDLVHRSVVLKSEILLSQFRWERRYINWSKLQVRKKLPTRTDEKTENSQNRRMVLEARLDSLAVYGDSIARRWSDTLTTLFSGLLKTKLTSEDEAYLLYHLGEFIYDRENERFSKEFTAYESKLDHYVDSVDSSPPSPPKLTHPESMAFYQRILNSFPQSSIVPAAMYSLAWCHSDIGNYDSAAILMKSLASRFTESEYTPQAHLFAGEYHFDAAQLDSAKQAYREVLKYPESEWFDKALYKLAWTQYRLSNPNKAISTFLALVDLGEDIGAQSGLLEKEAMDYVAISFSELDISGKKGLEKATAFVQKLRDVDKSTAILYRLASVYVEQGRYDAAREAFHRLLSLYPNYKENYLVERELIQLRERELPLDSVAELKTEYFTRYNRTSDWASRQSDSVAAQADSLVAHVLYDAGIALHQLTLQQPSNADYSAAANAYKRFIEFYPQHPKTNECHYNYAEILFSTGSFEKAAREYMEVSQRYPESKYRETAAWNAIVASRNLLESREDDN